MARKINPHEDKVKEIRDNFKEDFDHWSPIYKEGDINMVFLTDGPWDPEDKRARLAAGRPVYTADEISQYLNQAQNEVRLNPRSPKFSPEDEGANDDTARVYANAFRKTEYRSNAQEAYTSAYDNSLSRGFAFVRLKLAFEQPRSFYQQMTIEPVPNPNACYPDCNSLRIDGEDWERFTFIESYTRAEFERKFPEAEFTDFSTEQIAAVGQMWMGADRCQVAEYWEVITTEKVLIEYEVPATRTRPTSYVTVIEGERKPRGGKVVQERITETREVFSYLTNGVELLKKAGKVKHPYPGTMIPFAPCYAKMVWVNECGGPKRKIISMVTKARDPYAAYCFAAACELEAVGTITKNPYWAYEGQLDQNLKNRVKQSLHEPVAILEAKAKLDGLPGVLLPLPQRNPMAVDLSAYALVKEGARRAIQSAMQGTPMQSSMQRENQKLSGRAIDRMEDTGTKGNYHYSDNYNHMLRRIGVIFEDVFDKITDVERELITIEADENIKRVKVGGWNGKGQPPARPKDLDKDVDYVPSLKGRHAVIVDIGPEFESTRQAAETFLDNFIASPQFGVLEPPKRDKFLAMAIRERMLGPTGDKMADIIDPQQDGEMPPPEQLMAMLKEAQEVIIPGFQAEIQKLEQEKQAKIVETQGRMTIAAQTDKTKVQIAAMTTEQKQRDTDTDAETAIAVQQMRNEIELLKLQLQGISAGMQHEGGEQERALKAREGDESRALTAGENERNRQASASEGQASRDAAANEGEANRQAAARQAAQKETGE